MQFTVNENNRYVYNKHTPHSNAMGDKNGVGPTYPYGAP